MKATANLLIKIVIISIVLATANACSKQDSAEKKDGVTTSEANMKSEVPTQNKVAEMLPNEINVDDISGVNVEQDSSGKKVLFWEDPMVEGRHFNKSGKSPFMDMKLVPRHAE